MRPLLRVRRTFSIAYELGPKVVNLRVSRVLTHVLYDNFTVDFAIRSTTVLIRPFDWQIRPLVVIHFFALSEGRYLCDPILVLHCLIADGARASVPTLCIILTVQEAISIITIHVALTVSIIASSGIVHVNVCAYIAADTHENPERRKAVVSVTVF